MAYTDEQIEQIEGSLDEWLSRQENISLKFACASYSTQKGREFALHGLGRRVSTVGHCIRRLFETIPLEETHPDRETLMDATIYLQTLAFNIFGAIENMAHIWKEERDINFLKGKKITRHDIGFWEKESNKEFKKTLPDSFREYLASQYEWSTYLVNYRDALAHRIPLYIPPRAWSESDAALHRTLDKEKGRAIRNHQWERVDELDDQMDQIGSFPGYTMHSFEENSKPMRFHVQAVCDLMTLVDMAERFAEALGI